jgi:tRNA C32,U32 (ribose-2'-O)-methylase TrmJ
VGGFSDTYKDFVTENFMKEWAPKREEIGEPTVENLRWNIARANAAEHELRELKNALKTLKKAIS